MVLLEGLEYFVTLRIRISGDTHEKLHEVALS